MFIGKCSENGPLGFGEGARRRLGGRGISKISLRHHAPSFDTTGRRVSDRMCERGRHPQG